MNECIPGSSIPALLEGRKTTQCLSPLFSFYRNLQNTPRCILTIPGLTRCSVVKSKNNMSYHSPKYYPEFYTLKLTELCFFFSQQRAYSTGGRDFPHVSFLLLWWKGSPSPENAKNFTGLLIPIGLNFFLKDYSRLVDLVESAVFFMALSVTVLKIIPHALTPPRLSVPFLLR